METFVRRVLGPGGVPVSRAEAAGYLRAVLGTVEDARFRRALQGLVLYRYDDPQMNLALLQFVTACGSMRRVRVCPETAAAAKGAASTGYAPGAEAFQKVDCADLRARAQQQEQRYARCSFCGLKLIQDDDCGRNEYCGHPCHWSCLEKARRAARGEAAVKCGACVDELMISFLAKIRTLDEAADAYRMEVETRLDRHAQQLRDMVAADDRVVEAAMRTPPPAVPPVPPLPASHGMVSILVALCNTPVAAMVVAAKMGCDAVSSLPVLPGDEVWLHGVDTLQEYVRTVLYVLFLSLFLRMGQQAFQHWQG